MSTGSQLAKKKATAVSASTMTHSQMKPRSFSADFAKPTAPTSTDLSNLSMQPKLTIGSSNDKYEQEADRVAAKVVKQINTPAQPSTVQRKGIGSKSAAAPDFETTMKKAKGKGKPMADSIRQPMEQAFGRSFSGVKVHTDSTANQLNHSIQAKAFANGQDVFFRQGAYNPGSRGGQELLAHELTHVVQQTGTVQRKGIGGLVRGAKKKMKNFLGMTPKTEAEKEAKRERRQAKEALRIAKGGQTKEELDETFGELGF